MNTVVAYMLVTAVGGFELNEATLASVASREITVERSGGTVDTFPTASRGGSSGSQGFPDSRYGGENDTGWNELVFREGSGGGDGSPKF